MPSLKRMRLAAGKGLENFLWIIVALLVAGAIVFATSLKTRRTLPKLDLPDGEELPKTLMQRRAGWALLAVVLLTGIAAGCLVWFGPRAWWDVDAIRHVVTALMLGALLVFLVFTMSARALEAAAAHPA